MTTLASTPIHDPHQLDLLALVADTSSPLGSLHHADFREACEATAHEGWVNPNLVSAWLHARFGEVAPRWLSSQWNVACSRQGFLDKTDRWVPIDGTHSRGNGGKSVRLRRLRGAS